MKKLREVIREHASDFEDYLLKTDTIVVAMTDEYLNISTYNSCFSKLISPQNNALGNPIKSFLMPESADILPLQDAKKNLSTWLNFKSPDCSSLPIQCNIVKFENGKHLILGGHIMLSNEHILQKMTIMSNEMANMARDLRKKNRDLKEAQSQIKTLSGIIPICLHCKEIRDDKGYWNRLEKYIMEHSDAQFSHGICDKCLKKHYPDVVL